MRIELRGLRRKAVVDVSAATAEGEPGRFHSIIFRSLLFITACLLSPVYAAIAAQPTWSSFPAIGKYRVENAGQPLPVFADSTEACVHAVAIVESRSPNSGWQYSNVRYVPRAETSYPGCHHTLTAVGPTAGGYPIGTVLQGTGQNWVIPVPSCPAGFTMVGPSDSWRCGRWSNSVDPAKPSQCDVPSAEVGNPIACAGGNKVERRSDSIFAGFSIDHKFSSVYGSQTSPFGKNWSSALTAEVLGDRAGEGMVFVFLPTGGALPFVKLATGGWSAQQSDLIAYELKELFSADGSFSGWRLRVGSTFYLFDKIGHLSAVEQNGVLQVSLVRNAVGETTHLVSPNGRVATLHYQSYMTVDRIDLPGGGVIDYGYDNKGRLIDVSVDGATTSYVYGEKGGATRVEMIGKVDEDGQLASSFSYDASGRASATESPGGVNTFELSYADSGNHVAVTTPLGALKHFYFDVYNSGRRLRRQVDACSGCASTETLYGYDEKGLLSEVSRNSVITAYRRDAKGRVTLKTEAAGTVQAKVTETHWDDSVSLPDSIFNYDGQGAIVGTRFFEYNGRRQTLKSMQIDSAGKSRVETTAYCEAEDLSAGACPLLGLVTSVDGPRTDVADVTTYTYRMADEESCASSSAACLYRKGDLWKVTGPLGHVTEILSYDGAGRVLSVRGANDVITNFEYHPRGWLTATKVRGYDDSTEADDRITRMEYLANGLIKTIIQPDGTFTTFSYDPARRLTDVTDSVGNSIHYTLDSAGNRIVEETKDSAGALKKTLSRVYNQLGQLITQADAYANPTDFGYDANGNATSITNALGRVTAHEYDPLKRLKRTVQDVGGIGAESHFRYDALDNLIEVTDPKGLTTRYARNGFGEVVQQTSPDTGVTTFTYDNAGNVQTRTDARGVTATYAYDALGRTTATIFGDPAADIQYIYDQPSAACAVGERTGTGRLASMIDGSGRTDYCYNAMGDLVRRVQTVEGQALTLRYAYDALGRMQSMTYPDGSLVDYGYNTLGQVSAMGVTPAGGSREVLLKGLKTLPFGPVKTWTFGNGRQLDRSYDQDYRPVAISDARDGLNIAFGFDPVSNITSLSDVGLQRQDATLDYDALGRLTAFRDARTGVAIEQYSYDATGNRLSFANATGLQTYAYAADSHRLTAVDAAERVYDSTGNTLSIGSEWQYAYDLAGRLSSATRLGSLQAIYRHNGAGQRVMRQAASEANLSLHGEGGEWLGVYGATGTPSQQVIWLGSTPVGLIQAGRVFYIEADHLGSPRALVDPRRDATVWEWSSMGESFGSGAPSGDVDQDGVEQTLDLRFPGQSWDEASGLTYNYFRDYDAGTGRYAQSDPIGLGGGWSTYGYVGGDPAGSSDSFGLQRYRSSPVPNPWLGGSYDHYNERPYNDGYQGSGSSRSGGGIGNAIGFTFLLSQPARWGDSGGLSGALLGGLFGSALDSMQESRGKGDPAVLPPVNPGRDCDGNCNPCPPGVRWYVNRPGHGHANGYWHVIKYNQDPSSCMCYPDRPSAGLQGN